MEKQKLSLLILALFFELAFTSCDLIQFKDPQPSDLKSLNEFPTDIQGTYIGYDDDDTIRVYIHKNRIEFHMTNLAQYYPGDSVEADDTIKEFIIRNRGDQDQNKILITDSVSFVRKGKLMFFQIGQDSILKVDNGHYYLNKKKKTQWELLTIRKDLDTLYFEYIEATSHNLEKIIGYNISETRRDSLGEIINEDISIKAKDWRKIHKLGLGEIVIKVVPID